MVSLNPFSLSAVRVVTEGTGFGAQDRISLNGGDLRAHVDQNFDMKELHQRFRIHQAARKSLLAASNSTQRQAAFRDTSSFENSSGEVILKHGDLVRSYKRQGANKHIGFLDMMPSESVNAFELQTGLSEFHVGPERQWALARLANAAHRRADTFSTLRQSGLVALVTLAGALLLHKVRPDWKVALGTVALGALWIGSRQQQKFYGEFAGYLTAVSLAHQQLYYEKQTSENTTWHNAGIHRSLKDPIDSWAVQSFRNWMPITTRGTTALQRFFPESVGVVLANTRDPKASSSASTATGWILPSNWEPAGQQTQNT